MGEIATTDIQKTIRERIQADFVGLIGDEAWDKLVSDTLHRFTTDQPTYAGSNRVTPSELQSLLDEAIREKAIAKIDAAAKELAEKWDVQKILAEYISKNADKILSSLLLQLFDTQLRSMATNLRMEMPKQANCINCNQVSIVPFSGGPCSHCGSWISP